MSRLGRPGEQAALPAAFVDAEQARAWRDRLDQAWRHCEALGRQSAYFELLDWFGREAQLEGLESLRAVEYHCETLGGADVRIELVFEDGRIVEDGRDGRSMERVAWSMGARDRRSDMRRDPSADALVKKARKMLWEWLPGWDDPEASHPIFEPKGLPASAQGLKSALFDPAEIAEWEAAALGGEVGQAPGLGHRPKARKAL